MPEPPEPDPDPELLEPEPELLEPEPELLDPELLPDEPLLGGGAEWVPLPELVPLPEPLLPEGVLGGGELGSLTPRPAVLVPDPALVDCEPADDETDGVEATVRVTGVLVTAGDEAAGADAWCWTGGGAGRA